MKIKNVSVDIKIGKKTYRLRNLILNVLLNEYAKCILPENIRVGIRNLGACLFKFDSPITFDATTNIQNEDFDIQILDVSTQTQITPNKIATKYIYSDDYILLQTASPYNNGAKWSDFIGKKIYTIGFNHTFINTATAPVKAIIDVSAYNIYVEEGSNIAVTRIDEIENDALFWSNSDKITGPVHLAPNGMEQLIYQPPLFSVDGTSGDYPYDRSYAKLTDIGLGYNTNIMIESGLLSLSQSNNEITLGDISNSDVGLGIFPSATTFPSTTLYPQQSNYKYYLMKFNIMQLVTVGTYEDNTQVDVDTGYYYYQAIPITNIDNITIKKIYERGT